MAGSVAAARAALRLDPRHSSPTLVDALRQRAEARDASGSFTFVDESGKETEELSLGEIDRRARIVAAALQRAGLEGERLLLLYPPGLEFIPALIGCFYAGVTAVPILPPGRGSVPRESSRLEHIAADAEPAAVLSTESIELLRGRLLGDASRLAGLPWIASDALARELGDDWQVGSVDPDSVAFLQYTSGSTAAPKGVVVSHANLIANCRAIGQRLGLRAGDRGASWLPIYHDMGLIGKVLTPVLLGIPVVMLSPMTFLRRPLRWLQLITRHRATLSAAPNFAYDLCVRRLRPGDLDGLDLSCWRAALNGSEPIRPRTIDAFSRAFAPCGFRREAFLPCYGLAEATLYVAGADVERRPTERCFSAEALERGRAVEVEPGPGTRTLVGCGFPASGHRISIVDPDSRRPLAHGEIGEICVSGPSIARGYWGRRPESRDTFADHPSGSGDRPQLRTGDLGFLRHGELFVTGRLKDLIVIHGRNVAPQDVELTVEENCPEVRPGYGAAFAVEEDGAERVVVVYQLQPSADRSPVELARRIREVVAGEHGLPLHSVVLGQSLCVPRTSSGKIERNACRKAFLAGDYADWAFVA